MGAEAQCWPQQMSLQGLQDAVVGELYPDLVKARAGHHCSKATVNAGGQLLRQRAGCPQLLAALTPGDKATPPPNMQWGSR